MGNALEKALNPICMDWKIVIKVCASLRITWCVASSVSCIFSLLAGKHWMNIRLGYFAVSLQKPVPRPWILLGISLVLNLFLSHLCLLHLRVIIPVIFFQELLLAEVVLTSPSWRPAVPITNTRRRETAGRVSVVWPWMWVYLHLEFSLQFFTV